MSLMFTIAEREDSPYTHRIWDLCQHLTVKVLKPFLDRHQVAWERHAGEFFAPAKGETPFEPTGRIWFRPPAMFLGQLGELENAIRAALDALGIRTGPWEQLRPQGDPMDRVMVIPVLENPTANSGPPEVNISNNAGSLVLRDLLGYRHAKGVYDMLASDLIVRLGAINESQILKCSTRTVRDPQEPVRLRVTQSAATANRIRRCLDEVRRFAQWAHQHNYERLRAA